LRERETPCVYARALVRIIIGAPPWISERDDVPGTLRGPRPACQPDFGCFFDSTWVELECANSTWVESTGFNST